MRVRSLSLSLLGLVASGLAVVAFVSLSGRGPDGSAATDAVRVRACVPVGVTAVDGMAVRRCLADLMGEAIRSGRAREFVLLLEREVTADERLYAACHAAAHMAGQEAIEGSVEPLALLDEVAVNTVCDWGFGHGVIDATALRGASPADAAAVGHYAWSSTGDLARSVALCETLVAGRVTCGGGVLMQIFEPAVEVSLEGRPADVHERILELCRRWSGLAVSVEGRSGCWHGAGYVYGLDVRDAAYRWLNSVAAGSGTGLDEKSRREIHGSVRSGVGRCAELGGDATLVQLCVVMVARSVPPLFARGFPAELEAPCGLVPDEVGREVCLRRGEQTAI